ncbi:GNAT family N-acetyltransferase [Candidatus Peregrinibacteria bacterium HGW-Peregrinibacteria-1]|jgi:GNAT superfamily N-acetyltransferase|nr:MAG: GNAT family N-acetyltransferase [Candidatus Peregrinibacteria bacterium HGW-Peregrinibacteria-1]
MQVRRYKPGEEQELWQLYHDTTHIINGEVYTREQVERWAPHDKDMDEWKERIQKKNPFVAVGDDKIVGFAELEPDGHIDYFYVHHKYQGKGVGSMLYTAIEKEAINQKIPHLHAEVSVPAKEFFLKQGFEILEKKNNIICGTPAINFMMKKQL